MKTFFWSTIAFFVLSIFLTGQRESKALDFPLFQSRGKVEAEPNKEYPLQESSGSWFIMVHKFSGDNARKKANRLIYELRKRYKVPAYIYKYDPDKNDLDELAQRQGMVRRVRYQTPRSSQYAVLAGGYPTNEDLEMQKMLLTIKRSRPESLKNDQEAINIQKRYENMAHKNREFAGFGPLGDAMIVPNPLLPDEYFSQKGIVDSFIAKINSDSKYSLLNNPKMYTLRVATFSGDTVFQRDGGTSRELGSNLQMAGIKAAALCEALRSQGVEAWEFHDRDSSFVTIGGFDSYGSQLANGMIEMNPQIEQLMEKYKGELVQTGTKGEYKAYTVDVEIKDPESTGLMSKKKKMSIAFDLQPVIIMVPQRSSEAALRRIQKAQDKLSTELHQQELARTQEYLEQENPRHNHEFRQKAQYVADQAKLDALEAEKRNGSLTGHKISGQPPMVALNPAPTENNVHNYSGNGTAVPQGTIQQSAGMPQVNNNQTAVSYGQNVPFVNSPIQQSGQQLSNGQQQAVKQVNQPVSTGKGYGNSPARTTGQKTAPTY